MNCKRTSISRDLSIVYEYELDQFSRVTNLHGLARWREARSSSKVFWAVVGIAIVTFSISQVVSLFSIYFSHPTVSQVSFVAPDDGLAFPVVTICNYNPVKASVANEYQMDGSVLEYVLMAYMAPGDLSASYDFDQVDALHKQYQNYVHDYQNRTGTDFSLPGFFMDAGYKCEDIFLSCSFGGVPFDCCQYAEPLLTDMGLCYRFRNYGRTGGTRQFLPGPYYGFEAFLNIQLDEYPIPSVKNFYNFGIRMNIQNDESTPTMNYGAFSVSPGNRFYAGILPTHYTLLPQGQWGTCLDKWPTNANVKSSQIYTRRSCRSKCEADSFLETCNCVPQRNVPEEDQPVCDSLQMYSCTRNGFTNFRDESYWTAQCNHCAVECSKWNYEIQTSYVRIPSPGATKNLMERFNLTEYDVDNLVAVTAHFAEVAYTEYTQMWATTLAQTFSDIGGILGLFLGFSVVTVFELVIFICKILWGFGSRRRRQMLLVRDNLETLSKRKFGNAPSPYNQQSQSRNSIFYLIPNETGYEKK